MYNVHGFERNGDGRIYIIHRTFKKGDMESSLSQFLGPKGILLDPRGKGQQKCPYYP